MTHRQRLPEQWLIADSRMGEELWRALRKLPQGSGVIVLRELSAGERRRLRQVAGLRRLLVLDDRRIARVHNVGELRAALLRRYELILVSPLYETRSHPDWSRLPRMRAATLARLAGRKAMALGGMNRQRYAKVAGLGFIGWAGIDAFRT